MDTNTNLPTTDHQSTESRMTVVVILTPESNDTALADVWDCSFKQLGSQFKMLGIDAVAAPWSTTPLDSDSSHSFIYVANLAWGYHQLTERWDAWLRAWPREIKLINSPALLSWNTRKTYLKDLEKAGVAIIPTLCVEHIDERMLVDASMYFDVSDLIVKPQISASSFNTVRVLLNSTDFTSAPRSLSASAAVAELTRLGANQSPMMIQPFMTSVAVEGEVSILVFDGKVSHAVRHNAHPDDYRVQFEFGGTSIAMEEPSNEMLQLAHAALAACPEPPVYARVDMIRNDITGHLCLSELELIEPNLYLEHAPDGGMAFVRAIMETSSPNVS